jgi:glycosyltransferase involved in cell wall biosynthesis
VDLQRFQPAAPGTPREFDLVHAGSWSGLYLVRETLQFFEAYRELRPDARLLVLVPRAADVGTAPPGVEIRSVPPHAVPPLLARARAGLSLRRAGRAQVAASPVKVSEYLACGLPVVSTTGVGDLDRLLLERRVGVLVPGFSPDELRAAARSLVELQGDAELLSRCRRLAEETFALDAAVASYDGVYRAALG